MTPAEIADTRASHQIADRADWLMTGHEYLAGDPAPQAPVCFLRHEPPEDDVRMTDIGEYVCRRCRQLFGFTATAEINTPSAPRRADQGERPQ